MPLRVRLTIVYVVLLALALTASAVAGYLIAARRIYDSVDQGLEIHAHTVTETVAPLAGPLTLERIQAHLPELNSQAAADLVFQIRGVEGDILYSSQQPSSISLPPSSQPAGVISFATQDVRGQDLRILYEPVLGADGRVAGTVEVGQSLKGTNDALTEIRNVFILIGIIVATVTTVSAYTLAGRALRPVGNVSNVARDIQRTGDFRRRLTIPNTRDEVAELVSTVNAMIERVEQTLAAQKSFLADSSHELRRPLTVITTNIDLLNNRDLPPEDRRECLREMREEAAVMGKLLADLLLLAREESQAIERVPVDLSGLCRSAAERLAAQDGQHELRSQIADGIQVMGDKERLEQMLRNLLENATQYTPERGQIALRLSRANGSAEISVEDTGAGIGERDLPHIFERFYRGESARSARPDGTGLGLSIVKYVAEAHGGTVSVKSRAGAGTAFTVDLPLDDAAGG